MSSALPITLPIGMVCTLKKEDWFPADGFPLAVERRDPQQPFGLHAHDFSELVIVTGGAGLHVLGTESWRLTAGDAFVIAGPQPHDYQELADLRLINILFDLNDLKLRLWDLTKVPGYHAMFTLEPAWRKQHQFKSRLHLSARDLGIVEGLIDTLDQELKTRDPGFGFLAVAAFMQIVGFLSRCYGESKHPDARALLRIAESIAFLEMRFEEPVKLEELARIADMPKRNFMRTFKLATGSTPINYLIQLRINQAARLLRASNESVTDIAFDVGFSDSNYFSRQFRKLMGVSPREYRRQSNGTRSSP